MNLDLKELGMDMTIVKTAKDTGGQSFEMKWTLSPNSGGTPLHIHPAATETYEILKGEMEVYKGNQWITARTGDKIVIEQGMPHTFKNITNQYVEVYNIHEPAMEFENFFKGLAKFAQSGLVKNGKMTLKSIIGVSTLWTNYPNEIISVKPPAVVMRMFGFVGRSLGINFK